MSRKEELAIAELIGKCEFMNATQIAKLQLSLKQLGLEKLAELVREQGEINAGAEYETEYNQVIKG